MRGIAEDDMQTLLAAGLMALGTTALGLSGAMAQDITTGHLAALDTNADGAVDSAEFGDFAARAFQTMDVDGDGVLTQAEAASVMPSELFDAADMNLDAGVSPDEFMNQTQRDFASADRDGNGLLD
jgi:hypothetical protein